MYKKLYEIEGFDTGVKVRHKDFGKNSFYFYSKVENEWLDESGEQAEFYYFYQFQRPVWEVYEEPKKEEWIKFYRVFDIEEGHFVSICLTKNNNYIENCRFNITTRRKDLFTTDIVAYEALFNFNEDNKVLKYRFPNNEVLEV